MIRIQCSNCGAKLKAPDEAAGKTTKCPKCGSSVSIVEPVYDAEPLSDAGPPADVYGLDDPAPALAPKESGTEPRKPCPMCGEMIVASAAKCRFCGEVFDESLKKAEKKKKRLSGDPSAQDMTTGDWFAAVLCSGIGCIAGIIWMIQGKPKGAKMFGVSFLFVIIWSVVRVALQQAAQR